MKRKSYRIYHTATYNGREHTATTTEWHKIIGCPRTRIENALRKHGSMQQVINVEFADSQRIARLARAFTLGVAYK